MMPLLEWMNFTSTGGKGYADFEARGFHGLDLRHLMRAGRFFPFVA
jgi:hypothetical protein